MCAGRQRTDGLECFVAVTTEAFAHALIEERPLTSEGGAYVPQTAEYLSAVAPRIWEQLCSLMGPFPGAATLPPRHLSCLLHWPPASC
jgi:hypothetical protein